MEAYAVSWKWKHKTRMTTWVTLIQCTEYLYKQEDLRASQFDDKVINLGEARGERIANYLGWKVINDIVALVTLIKELEGKVK